MSTKLVDASRENNDLKAKLNGSHVDVAPFKSLHNDMSDKDCDFCLVVMEDLDTLRNVHDQVASQLESAMSELDELKAKETPLDACFQCPEFKLELDGCFLKVKELETELLEKSRVLMTPPPCEACGSLKGNLVHGTSENTILVQDVSYLTSRLERTDD